jgi:hypothetical protein
MAAARFEPRTYQAQMYCGQTDLRLGGQGYLIDLDLRSERAVLDISYGRLEELLKRLFVLDGTRASDRPLCQLRLVEYPDGTSPIWWVPTRPDGEDMRWV